MGRTPLPLGGHGEIKAEQTDEGWTAWAYFRHPNTGKTIRRQVRGHRTKGAAVAALRTRLEKLKAGSGTGWTISRLMRAWLTTIEPTDGTDGIRPQTYEQYKRHSELYVEVQIGGLELAELTTYAAETFISGLVDRKTGAGASRARLAKVTLSLACAWGVRQGLMPANPVPGTSPVKKKKQPTRALSIEEVAALRELVHDWIPRPGVGGARPRGDFSEILDVLLGSGLRVGEAMALRWQEVDFGRARILVRGTMIERGPLYRQEIGKTDGSYRSIPIRPWVVELLRTRKQREGLPGDLVPVFTTKSGRHLAPSAVRRTMRLVLEETDLAWVTPHTFRRTTATVVEGGSGIEAARSLLGHSSSDVTEKHYVQRPDLVPEAYAVALDALAPV